MKIQMIIPIGIITSVVVVCGIALYSSISSRAAANAEHEARDNRLHDYCVQVHAAVDLDARDLVSGDERRMTAAADRFAQLTTFHSEQEIALCSKTAPNFDKRDRCWIAKDYDCLAELARAATASTADR